MPIPWNADPPGSSKQIETNLHALALVIKRDAPLRQPPTVAIAQDWHRQTFVGIVLPVPYYAGEIRDTDPAFPELIGYEVLIGGAQGVLSRDVPQELRSFVSGTSAMLATLDPRLPMGARPVTPQDLDAALWIAAIAHGEWIRIHPFANGNGRIARLWSNWVAARYGLPLFVSLQPRPASLLYGGAAALSMQGNHTAMVGVFHDLLRAYLRAHP